jgi:hypothetical protein
MQAAETVIFSAGKLIAGWKISIGSVSKNKQFLDLAIIG